MSSTLDANVMPGIYNWRALDIPKPEFDMGDSIDTEVPVNPQYVIQDALTNLIERLGKDFYVLPHQNPTINEPNSERDQIDREIGRIQSVMLAIKYDLRRRVALLGKRRNAMSIFNRLPPELAGHIFAHAFKSVPNSYMRFCGDYVSAGTLKDISSVSTRWWDLIKSCPDLWTTIVVQPGEKVEQKLRMSRTSPLTIIVPPRPIESSVPFDSTSPPIPFFDLLMRHSSRWKSLQIHVHTVDDLDRIRGALRSPASYLEDLKIFYHGPLHPSPLELIGTSNLRCLSVERVVLNPSTPGLRTVQSLTMGFTDIIGVQEILMVLNSTVAIKSLEIVRGGGHVVNRNVAEQPIHLPSLERFTLEETDSSAIELLANIYAESLSSLHIGYKHGNREEAHMMFQELIRPKGRSSVISTVIENAALSHLEMSIEEDAQLVILGKAAEVGVPLYDVHIMLTTQEGWGHHFENMVNFPKFAAALPPIHLSIDNMPLTFLLSMKTVTSLAITMSVTKCIELFGNILGHAHQVGENLVWACPNLNEIQLYRDTPEYLDTTATVMRNALRAREEAEVPEKLQKITVKRKGYNRRGTEAIWITVA